MIDAKKVQRASLALALVLAVSLVHAESGFLVRGVRIVAPDGAMPVARERNRNGTTTEISPHVPVEFFLPEKVAPFSIVMVPGGGLSSWGFTETPDGRLGWAQMFANAGIPVYLLNPPSGRRTQPGRWSKESVWSLWGFGPEYGAAYGDSKFPVAAIDTLEDSLYIARAPGGAAHISSLLDDIGPAYVLGHSAGGSAMFGIARAGHENLLGTIAIETIRCPVDAEQLRQIYAAGKLRFLSIWGDNLDRGSPSMLARYESCRAASDLISAAGGDAQTIRLPEDLGIDGNSHLLMQDSNSAEIAALLIDWMKKGASQ